MHPTVLAAARGSAIERIKIAATLLAEKHGLDFSLVDGVEAKAKDPQVRELKRLQGIADLLDAVCVGTSAVSVSAVTTDATEVIPEAQPVEPEPEAEVIPEAQPVSHRSRKKA